MSARLAGSRTSLSRILLFQLRPVAYVLLQDMASVCPQLRYTLPCETKQNTPDTAVRALFSGVTLTCRLAPNVFCQFCKPTTEVPVTEEQTSTAVDSQEGAEVVAKIDDDAAIAVGELRGDEYGCGCPRNNVLLEHVALRRALHACDAFAFIDHSAGVLAAVPRAARTCLKPCSCGYVCRCCQAVPYAVGSGAMKATPWKRLALSGGGYT